jgi:hypothetical protein
MTPAEHARLLDMLRSPHTQKDATIIWLSEKVIELNQRLAEIRSAVNRK